MVSSSYNGGRPDHLRKHKGLDSPEYPVPPRRRIPSRAIKSLDSEGAGAIRSAEPKSFTSRNSFSTESNETQSDHSEWAKVVARRSRDSLDDQIAPQNLLTSSENTNNVAGHIFYEEEIQFKQIGKGAAKRVWEIRDLPRFQDKAYLTAISGLFEKIFGTKKAEIKKEVYVAAKIKAKLPKDVESNIATNLTVMTYKHMKRKGKFTVETDKAAMTDKPAGNNGVTLDHLITDGRLDTGQRLELCCQLLKGLNNMHEAGFVHGDLKGGNVLLFKVQDQPVLRVCDFGKTKETFDDNESFIYTGNARFAPPEFRASKKGEVYGAALLMVRILEEEFLDDTHKMMEPEIKPTLVLDAKSAGKGLRGISLFLTTNSKCPQTNSNTFLGKIRLLKGLISAVVKKPFNSSKKSKLAAENEVKGYINALIDAMKKRGITIQQQNALKEISDTLHGMVQSDPKKRPDMSTVLGVFNGCLEKYANRSQV
jgi:serine/threonine protein kinase